MGAADRSSRAGDRVDAVVGRAGDRVGVRLASGAATAVILATVLAYFVSAICDWAWWAVECWL